MSLAIPDFWRLVLESRLLSTEECQQLGARYGHLKGAADQASPKTLAQWLVSVNALSKYQAAILLAGRSGPFFYGEYKVFDRIDAGRWAGAFRAVHVPTNHPVLLHFLTGAVTQDAHIWGAVAAQTQTRSGILTPHVHRFLEAVDLGAYKFLVTEDVRGESLEELLKRAGRLAPADACHLVRQTALALGHLHQAGQVHADLTPRQIWIDQQGNVKLLHDPATFPYPVNFSGEDPNGPLAQRADYFAPELAQPGKPPDSLTDIYSLGCVFYQSLAGQPPFASGNAIQKMQRHATEPIVPLEPLGVPPQVAQIVAYMMAKNPAVRFQQAGIVAEQLGAFVDPQRLHAQPAPSPPTLPTFEAYLRQRPVGLSAMPVAAAAAMYAPAAPQPPMPSAPPPPAGIPVGATVAPVGVAVGAPVGTAIPTGTAVGKVAGGGPAAPAISTAATSSSAATTRLRAGRKTSKQKQLVMYVSIGGALLAMLLGFIILNGMGKKPPTEGDGDTVANHSTDKTGTPSTTTTPSTTKLPPVTNTSVTPTPTKPPVVPAGQLVVVPNTDAEWKNLLWASPTAGKEIALQNIPAGSIAFMIVRPADLLGAKEGPRVIQALGPQFQVIRDAWEKGAGVTLNEVEQVIIGFYPVENQFPRVATAVTLKNAVAIDGMLEKWGMPAATEASGKTYYKGASWSYYVPPNTADKVFVMGDEIEISELVKTGSAPLAAQMEKLRRSTDASRHVTILAQPSRVLSDIFPATGGKFYFGDANRIHKPLSWLLGEELPAVSFSTHFGNDTYLEMRMMGTLTKEKSRLADEMKKRIQLLPTEMENYITAIGSNPYWAKVQFRLVTMFKLLHDQTRIGVDDDVATVNAILPGPAAHNLIFGSEMMLASAGGGGSSTGTTAPTAPKIASIKDLLGNYNTRMMFDNQALDNTLVALTKDVKESNPGLPFEFKIRLMGPELRLDGITQNQAITNFNVEGSLAKLLDAIVLKANIDKTVKDVSESKQFLVWLIDKDPEKPTQDVIVVTTRAAAAKNKQTLPPQFAIKP